MEPADFKVRVQGGDDPLTVGIIILATDVVTREEQTTMNPWGGFPEADIKRDILKVAFLDRGNSPGKTFTGFIKGFGLRRGAFA